MPSLSRYACVSFAAALLLACRALTDDKESAPELQNSKPLSPKEAKASFKIARGFDINLVASEPDVVDPVAMAFDERGRIFVCEMRAYPNAGVGGGMIVSGQIKLLEDKDGDGFYEAGKVFYDGLRLPMSVFPWGKGVLVAVAPDLVYLEDSDDDGKAEKKTILYTGFDLANIQQLVNSLSLGIDGWVYGVAGSNGGTVRSVEKPDAPEVTLRNRAFRFKPDVPASLEPTSGGGQYGLTSDPWGRWFTSTNSQHLRHIILPDHALRRNPSLPVRAVTLDIPEHGAACKVFRQSPFEAWRVERTKRRKGAPDSARFATTELVPGGYSTSACSPLYYDASLFPKDYQGSIFICDPANNLVMRDVLSENGATFVAKRGHAESEFLASIDNWFRPVWLSLGPDGAIYVLDFYREVIETPLSLPEDIKKRLNLESRGRGRIWRIAPEGTAAFKDKPALHKAKTEELVALLAHDNAWQRTTSQRLLLERNDPKMIEPLKTMASRDRSARARALALWLLEAKGELTDELIVGVFHDSEPGVREQAFRLAERRLERSDDLLKALNSKVVNDPSPRVRFQIAITLGASNSPERLPHLATLLAHPQTDSWTQTALFSSCGNQANEFLDTMLTGALKDNKVEAKHRMALQTIATLAGATASDKEVSQTLTRLGKGGVVDWKLAVLEGLGDGRRNSSRSLGGAALKPYLAHLEKAARDEKASVSNRTTALRVMSHGSFAETKETFRELLAPQNAPEIQLAVIRAMTPLTDRGVASLLLERWTSYSPIVRRECTESLFARADRLLALLDAIEKKDVSANQLEPARLTLLKNHRDDAVRQRAGKVLAGAIAPQRQKIIDTYKTALDLKAERLAGKSVFKKTCASCHRLENEGHQVGADLLAALKNKTRDQLLIDILDPSREVDPRFQNYLVTTTKGQSLTGLLATETASSITLKRGEGAEDILLRSRIEEIKATGQSLMPDNLETQLSKQDLANLIEYLLNVGR